jgi:hypothetical protein
VKLARERGFLLADLERLFQGHGVASNERRFIQVIETNLAGATAITECWHDLLTSSEQLEDASVETNRVTAGAERQPVQVDRAGHG